MHKPYDTEIMGIQGWSLWHEFALADLGIEPGTEIYLVFDDCAMATLDPEVIRLDESVEVRAAQSVSEAIRLGWFWWNEGEEYEDSFEA